MLKLRHQKRNQSIHKDFWAVIETDCREEQKINSSHSWTQFCSFNPKIKVKSWYKVARK